jgi:hypothetical protein
MLDYELGFVSAALNRMLLRRNRLKRGDKGKRRDVHVFCGGGAVAIN